MSATELGKFLTFLAVERKVSASTQNQALSAILFLYKEVLSTSLETNFSFIGTKNQNVSLLFFQRKKYNKS